MFELMVGGASLAIVIGVIMVILAPIGILLTFLLDAYFVITDK